MELDWSELVASLDRCIISATPETDPAAADQQPDQSAADLKSPAVVALNHKLTELHSRLKSLDEDAGDLTSPSSSGNDLGAQGGASPASLVSQGTTRELVGRCKTVLGQQGRFETHALAAQLLAELARDEAGRRVCLEAGACTALEGALREQGRAKTGGLETTVQICRILGNLCFNCTEGRKQIMSTLCLQYIHAVAENRERIRTEDPGQRFPVILPGFLLNFCNENPDAVETAGEVGFVKVIVQNILSTQTNDAVFNSSLNFLVTVAEDECGHKYLKEASDFPKALNHILQFTTSPEVTETALELIRSIAEDPELTLLLAQSQLCTTIIKHIVGRWRCKEFEEHRSDACDLLVLILSHDASMKHIYSTDNGKFLNTFLGWLKKEDMQLKVAASLAIGNFACSEENCAQLMENKTANVLISLLKAHQNPSADLKLQHALLGSIRNLAVAPAARKQLLEQGLLDPCLRLTERLSLVTAQPVIFKLLATLRLVVDGNPEAAQRIGKSSATVTTLIEWGATDAQALRAESARLLAALIKHSQSAEVMETIVSAGGLAPVTTMLTSAHVRMLNEALVSLSVLAATLKPDVVHQQLHTDLVINGIKNCLKSQTVPPEVKKNALVFATQLMKAKREDFLKMLVDMQFRESLEESGDAKDFDEAKELLEALHNHQSSSQ